MNPTNSLLPGNFETLKNSLTNPGLVFRVEHYFIDHWLPLLGPNRAWLVVALQQACWQGRICSDSAEISQTELGRQCGLSRKRVNGLLNSDPLLRWFVPDIQAQFRHGKQQWNRYQVQLTSPPTPALAAGLRREIETRLAAGETLPDIVQALTTEAQTTRQALLTRLCTGPGFVTRPETVAEVVAATAHSALAGPLALAAAALSQQLLRPDLVRLETHYFRRAWRPRLGSTAAWLVVALRRRGDAADTAPPPGFSMGKQELAALVGVSSGTVSRVLSTADLPLFYPELQPGRRTVTGRIEMADPLTPADTATARMSEPPHTDFSDLTPNAPQIGPVTAELTDTGPGDRVKEGGPMKPPPREKPPRLQALPEGSTLPDSPRQASKTAAAFPQKPEPPALPPLAQRLLDWYHEEIGSATTCIKQQLQAAAIEIPAPEIWERAFGQMAAANKREWRYVLAIARRMHRDASAAAVATARPALEPLADQAGTPEESLWAETQLTLRRQMTQATYETIISPTRLVRVEGEVWTLTAPSVAAAWLSNRPQLQRIARQAAAFVAGHPVTLKILP